MLAEFTCVTFGTCQQSKGALFAALRVGLIENYCTGSCKSIQQAALNGTEVLRGVLILATTKSALDNTSNRIARGHILATALMPIF